MRVNLTHNDNIKKIDDVAHHIELEKDRLHAEKPINEVFMSETKMHGTYGSKYKMGEVKQDFQLYEIENLDYDTTSHLVEDLNETSNPHSNSGSDILSIPTLMEHNHEQSQPRRSICEPIPRCRFEIEGETFMISPQDDEEPQTLSDALSGLHSQANVESMEDLCQADLCSSHGY
ncbi:hypothetical protein DKX38_002928 [Salix brachista]|uniref:Uncharacterized protein n=1 Tax=Salix brachista TaxID=2182728 RepID=A0A5N5NNE0_9ROSI|nr:hypothetical protein DKX38_002928 [Salix brachista]